MKLWEETGGAEKHLQAEMLERMKENQIVGSLVRCPVCGERAKAVVFGYKEEGIWIGCDRSEECARNIEYHKEGWSLEETARDWNRRNSGIRLLIRRMKMLWERMFSRANRAARRISREREAEKRAKEARLAEIFGIERPRGGNKWRIIRRITRR